MASSVIEPAEREARLSDLVRSVRAMLRRRWRTLLLATALVFGLGLTLVMLKTPRYEATARVRIDPSRSPSQSTTADETQLGSEAIETEVTVLSSPELAREVVKRLNLQNDPEFNQGIKASVEGAGLDPEEGLNRVTAQVMRNLSVSREKLTYIIAVKYSSRDANKAAYIANAFATTYIDTRVNARIGTAARQGQFYRKQLAQAGAELNAAQQRAAQFRASTGITGGANGSINDQQVGPLSIQLATAEAQAAEARSNLAIARQQIGNGGLDAVSAVRSSTVISDLRRQRAEVERAKGEVDARYGPRHPDSIKIRDQLAALDQQINAEANRAIGSLQADTGAAEAQVASLRRNLGVLKSQQSNDTRASATAARLDQDVVNRKEAYDRLAQAADQSTQAQRNSIAQAEIVDRAQTPTAPAPPRKSVLAALALVVALAAGMSAVIAQEMLSAGMRGIADVEGRFGLPVLGSIPRVKRPGRGSPAAALLDDSTSMYAESLRSARSSLVGVRSSAAPRVVAITSALPDEGKSTTALSLARISGMAGTRTLLIECDVRRARLREAAGVQPSAGLVDVLREGLPVQEAVIADAAPGLDLLLVTQPYFSAEDLFGDGRMSRLLAELKPRYGLIVLDLPPVLGLADARTLAVQADAIALALRWGVTPVPAVEQTLAALRADQAPVAGFVFTMVDPKAEAMGGSYFSSKYAGYYTRAA